MCVTGCVKKLPTVASAVFTVGCHMFVTEGNHDSATLRLHCEATLCLKWLRCLNASPPLITVTHCWITQEGPGGNPSRPRHPTFPPVCLPVSCSRCLPLFASSFPVSSNPLFFPPSTQDGFLSDSHPLSPSSLGWRPLPAPSSSGGPHIWFPSCLLLLLFPIHLSHRSAASPFSLCFSIAVCNSVSRRSDSHPPAPPPQPLSLLHHPHPEKKNALPFLSLVLFLRLLVFRSLAARLTSATLCRGHFLFCFTLLFQSFSPSFWAKFNLRTFCAAFF